MPECSAEEKIPDGGGIESIFGIQADFLSVFQGAFFRMKKAIKSISSVYANSEYAGMCSTGYIRPC
jgi:hypothetical protein